LDDTFGQNMKVLVIQHGAGEVEYPVSDILVAAGRKPNVKVLLNALSYLVKS